MKKLVSGIAALSAMTVMGLAPTANAGEVRLGVWEHDAELFGLGANKGKESGINVSLEYVADSPDFLEWFFMARPHIGGSLNTNGDTSHVNAGLLWRVGLSDKIYTEYAGGLAMHNGTKEVPSPNFAATPAEIADRVFRKQNEIEFGSRVLLRNAFAFGYEVSDKVNVEIVWEHLSNATLFSDVNEGVDNVGIRVGRKF